MTNIEVQDRVHRQHVIRSERPVRFQQVLFRERVESLPVIRIDLALPIYRMQNGRTNVEQLAYISLRGIATTFFETGEENEDAQQAQHEILLRMSKDPVAAVYREMEHTRIQTEALIISSHGVVVNGNRRLAAMRDLVDENTYKEFQHVDVVVLPDNATEIDIETLETDLQMAPETKLEYGWVERRRKIRRQLEVLQISREKVKHMYRFRTDEELNRELSQLRLAELYLESYLAQPRAYWLVEKSYQIFKDLSEELENKDYQTAEEIKAIAFPLIKEARNLGQRAYSFNEAWGKYRQKLIERYASEAGIQDGISVDHATETFSSEDPLSASLAVIDPTVQIRKALIAPENSFEVAEKLVGIFSSLREEDRAVKGKRAALQAVQDAHRKLQSVDVATSDPTLLENILAQLQGIQATIVGIDAAIQKRLGTK